MMKGNKIRTFLLLFFVLSSVVEAEGHKDDFLSDILKLDISDSDTLTSPSRIHKKQKTESQKEKKQTNTEIKKTSELSELRAQIAALRAQNTKLQAGQ
ncbi:hypothetical protein AB9E48_00690, partial [Escherichia coli]|uniref:hypothetical protein n=1 Tax=Escherichia coli TaxID=562 RepID=UPI0038B584D8